MQLNETNNLSEYIAAGGCPDSVANQRIRSKLVEREVLHCITSTVDFIYRNCTQCDEIDYDDMQSLYDAYEWEEPARDHIIEMQRDDLLNWLEDHLVDLPGVDEDDEDEETDQGGDLTDDQLRNMVYEEIDGDWKDFCETESIDPHNVDVYEHWAVTKWFAGKLASFGEVTGELLDFDVWGRTTTGQAIAMDHIIAAIAAEMGVLQGQRSEWTD